MNYDNTNNVIDVPIVYLDRFRDIYPNVEIVNIGKYSFSFYSSQ